MIGEGFLDAWTARDILALIGTICIVFGLCNLNFGDRGDSEHLKRSDPGDNGP